MNLEESIFPVKNVCQFLHKATVVFEQESANLILRILCLYRQPDHWPFSAFGNRMAIIFATATTEPGVRAEIAPQQEERGGNGNEADYPTR
jgi:hypothetical protein